MPSRAGPAAAGAIVGVAATLEAPNRLATRSQDGPVAADAPSFPPLPEKAPLPVLATPAANIALIFGKQLLQNDDFKKGFSAHFHKNDFDHPEA